MFQKIGKVETNKERLFELIRNEDVIIWAGAGLSVYAGFPSGNDLSKILYESLTNSERNAVDANLPLPNLAEEIFRLMGGNRNSLTNILIDTFDKTPISMEYHTKLASIPHFKTIITTNFDSLLESAFDSDGQLVLNSKHIPYLDSNKVQIFKIHGDLSNPESIIITTSDYNKFFSNDSENKLYWTVIKERLATNSVLFLGYNLEDPNISVVFEKIAEELKSHQKARYVVAPNLIEHKIQDLNIKGFNYLNTTAEKLIDSLIEDIKGNIISDFESNKISPETFRKFLSNQNLLAELGSNKESFTLKSIKGANEEVEGSINLSIKDEFLETIEKFEKIIKGKDFGKVEISKDELSTLDVTYGGLRLPSTNAGILKFSSKPVYEDSIDIQYEDGFEINNLPLKVFASKYLLQIHISLKNSQLEITTRRPLELSSRYQIKFEHDDTFGKTSDEILTFELLIRFAQKKPFAVHNNSGDKIFKPAIIQSDVESDNPLLETANFYVEYFGNLKLIENHYGFRFKNIGFDTINLDSNSLVKKIVKTIKGQPISYSFIDEIGIETSEDISNSIDQLYKIKDENAPLTFHESKEEVVEIHGQLVNLGFKNTEIIEPVIINLDSLKEGTESVIKVRSNKNEVIVTYTKTSRGSSGK